MLFEKAETGKLIASVDEATMEKLDLYGAATDIRLVTDSKHKIYGWMFIRQKKKRPQGKFSELPCRIVHINEQHVLAFASIAKVTKEIETEIARMKLNKFKLLDPPLHKTNYNSLTTRLNLMGLYKSALPTQCSDVYGSGFSDKFLDGVANTLQRALKHIEEMKKQNQDKNAKNEITLSK